MGGWEGRRSGLGGGTAYGQEGVREGADGAGKAGMLAALYIIHSMSTTLVLNLCYTNAETMSFKPALLTWVLHRHRDAETLSA